MRAPTGKERKRLLFVALLLAACFSLLTAQFYKIQILEGEAWSKKAEGQHTFYVTEPFRRGRFLSNAAIRKGHFDKAQALVIDIEKFHLHIDPMTIPESSSVAIGDYLIEALRVPRDKQSRFRSNFNIKSRSRRLTMWLDRHERDALMEWWRPFAKKEKIPQNALYFVSDYQRSYPFGKLMGQLLQTVQNIKDPKTGQAIPTGGLEYTFNDLLQGKKGIRRLRRSPRNAFETGEVIEHPEEGADITLTLNHCLQEICEEELEKGVQQAEAKAAWAVMMDPFNGHILALAQYPFFYPPDYRRYFTDKELSEHTHVKAASDAQEPASVVKAITAAIALLANDELKKRGEAPLFDPEEKVATSNGKFPGRSRPIKDTRVHNFLNMDMAVQKSSNIYVGRIVERIIQRLGSDWYRQALETFGFGKKSGVEIPSESAGLLPRPGRKYSNGKLEWSVPTPFSLAMGYNLQATAIQVVRAFSAFANGGFLVQPTIVKQIVKNNKIIADHDNQDWTCNAVRILPREIVDRVVKSIKYVTKPGGGGWRGEVWGYTEAGKTGTAKKIVDGAYSSKSYCCNFIGFPVVGNPPFVLMVVIDEPGTSYREGVGHIYYGSISAAPVFKEICRRSLEYLGIKPDDPCGYPANDPRCDPAKADWKKESDRLQEKYQKWNN